MGIRHAELVNWTGQAIVCPRARIAQLAVATPRLYDATETFFRKPT
jgi:hypothetical protein